MTTDHDDEKTNPGTPIVRAATGDPVGAPEPYAFLREATSSLLTVHEDQKRWRHDLFDEDGAFSKLLDRKLGAVKEAADAALAASKATQDDVAQLVPRIKKLEERMGEIERDMAKLKQDFLDLRAAQP